MPSLVDTVHKLHNVIHKIGVVDYKLYTISSLPNNYGRPSIIASLPCDTVYLVDPVKVLP